MGFNCFRSFNFRNLEDKEVNLNSPSIFLIGKNGQGKTNFIEGIYILCFGASFRTNHDQRMIKEEKELSKIQGIFDHGKELKRDISVRLSRKSKKEIRIDSKRIHDRKELIENIPCILFSPEDLSFIKGPPECRRWFFNQTLSLFDITFIDLLRDYKRVLKSRNILLKQKNTELFDIYNDKLAQLGLTIQSKRELIIGEFNQTFLAIFKKISGLEENLEIIYKPSWKEMVSKNDVIRLLENNLEKDILMGTTTTGPHRDIFSFYLRKKDFTYFASTGQVRLISLILKVAQAEFLYQKSRKKSVLLLDDVLLELDAKKRESFLNNLPMHDQAMFTFLPDENYIKYRREDTLIYSVSEGKLEEQKV
ncbi:MAG TPA: DNA replication/repair protein RecF [Candidatus Aminicenantes bacterium]|nr:DNA replication/repair protein RecF [Candidatus Aminicenantes bacterium]